MPRSVYSTSLRNRTARLKLPVRKKPFKVLIAPGVHLCYRRNEGPGTWSVQAGWLKRFALADDHEEANGKSVMSYFQATQFALKMVRGTEGNTDAPVTIDAALTAYETDLGARDGAKYNATSVRNHCSPAMLSKVVALLTDTELADWRNGLVAKGLKLSSANRIGKSLKAALALAAKRDSKRIKNREAWIDGLKPRKDKGTKAAPRDNFWLPDQAINSIVRECYLEDADFGALVHVLAETGARESQALKLYPADLIDTNPDKPSLMVWTSNKGRNDREPEQRSVPITSRLAQVLRERAAKQGRKNPLFEKSWNVSPRFRAVLKRLGLDETLTPYVCRHCSIIRQILANKRSVYLIAYDHDTSETEIRKTYARYLERAKQSESDDNARAGLLTTTPADNVMQLAS
jgi:integrase